MQGADNRLRQSAGCHDRILRMYSSVKTYLQSSKYESSTCGSSHWSWLIKDHHVSICLCMMQVGMFPNWWIHDLKINSGRETVDEARTS